MLRRILEQEKAISAVLLASGKPRDRDMMLLSTELSEMQSLASVLKPLAHATETLSAEKSPTISVIQPILTALLKKHLCPSDDDSTGVADIKSAIASGLRMRFIDPDISKVTLMASAIDPRFKSLRFLSSPQKEEVYVNLKAAAIAMYPPDEPVEVPPAKKHKNSADDLLEYRESNGSSPDDAPDDIIEREIENYKSEPQVDRDADPLDWWRKRHDHLKYLSRLARKLLSMQGTSVPSERLFSTAGFLVDKRRSCLHPASVDMLLFLNKNY